jgi:hypothetical protein
MEGKKSLASEREREQARSEAINERSSQEVLTVAAGEFFLAAQPCDRNWKVEKLSIPP